MATMAAAGSSNVAVAKRDLPFLKYRVDSVERPDHDGDMTGDEMLKLLGLDFTVETRKVYTHTPKGHRITIPDTFANVRTDTEDFLGIVGKQYVVQQNSVVAGMANALLDTGEALGESGFALRGGRSIGLMFRIPSHDISVPGDGGGILPMYLGLMNSHDGNSSLSGFLGPVRLACTNMVRLFVRSAVSSFKIRHTSGATGKIAAMRDALGISFRYKVEFEKVADQLLHVTLAESQVDEILKAAFPIKPDSSQAQIEKSVQHALMANWQSSPTIEGVRGTAWGLVNSTNEYFEHLQPVRTRTYDRDSVRAISILQGTAFQSTNRVAEILLRDYA